jgi:hypothetical protein
MGRRIYSRHTAGRHQDIPQGRPIARIAVMLIKTSVRDSTRKMFGANTTPIAPYFRSDGIDRSPDASLTIEHLTSTFRLHAGAKTDLSGPFLIADFMRIMHVENSDP